MKGLVFFAVRGVAGLALGALEENTIQSRKKMTGFSIGYEMITVLSFFHCQRVGGLVLGASEENTI